MFLDLVPTRKHRSILRHMWSHSGLNVDRLVKTSGTQFAKHKKGLGMAMLTIQKTPFDDIAGLRIFSKCDDFMMVVLKKLRLTIDLGSS